MPVTTKKTASHGEAIKAFLKAPKEAVAIVPNTIWADEITKRLIANDNVLLGRRVYSLQNFIREHSKKPNGPVISRQLQKHLIRRLLKATEMAYFKKASAGIVNLFYSAISKLKQNQILPDELTLILETRGSVKENDLLKLYRAYEKELFSKGWFDEESLASSIELKRNAPLFLIGFARNEPLFKKITAEAVLFEAAAEAAFTPKVFALGSPFAESRFVAGKIDEAVKDGTKPSDIGIFLPANDPFAWDILKECGIVKPQNALPTILSRIFSAMPEKESLSDKLSHEIERISKTDSPLKTRTLIQLDNINKTLQSLLFEESMFENPHNFAKSELIGYLSDAGHIEWPDELPFRLISFENAGLYETAVSIIPSLNEGSLLPSPSSVKLFGEPDTLSAEPDERIDALFPSQENMIKEALAKLYSAYSKNTVISYHLYDASGREAFALPFIAKSDIQIIFEEPANVFFAGKSCGTNFSGSALQKLKEYAKDKHFSATQLEDYGKCPFAYFCKHILAIEPPEALTPEVQPKDRGTLIHEALELFFKRFGNLFIEMIDSKAAKEKLHEHIAKIVEDVFGSRADLTAQNDKNLVSHLKFRTTLVLIKVLENELEFIKKTPQRPAYFEMPFDEMMEGNIRMKGKIDRIDADDSTFTILDYKTGTINPVISGIEKGTHLQIPIYTAIAERKLKKEPAAAFLYSIKTQSRKSGIVRKELKESSIGANKPPRYMVSEDEWKDLIELGLKKASHYVEQIRKGCFEGEPAKCEAYCEWKDACRC
ncbi:MAG: PD-(D/E)XK nuclease family protein [Deltaproteobacteria bacterium]|nr:PD-(D/E)XK nuclease family protein [Deltaproteobacteria bacterium]